LRNTGSIQIMRDGFQPDQLDRIVEALREDQQRCSFFSNVSEINAVISSPNTKMMIVGNQAVELPLLVETISNSSLNVPRVPIIYYLKQSTADFKEKLLFSSADDFLLDPLNIQDLRLRIKRLESRASDEQDDLEQIKKSLVSHFGMRQFIGRAPAFLSLIEKIPRIAGCDAPVLLTGETGTGKEMCARAIHYLSPRANKAFVPINCGSIPADLFENEMFGHEPGAYTDARNTQHGFIAEAEGGTIFLDEIDSLPHVAQVKLLRFLQDGQYKPLGGTKYRQANTRLITASNQDLRKKVSEKVFREDLFYRLKVVSLFMPALRERGEDIVPLAHHFLETSAREYNRSVTSFSQQALEKLCSYSWPGNIRELENVVREAVVMAPDECVRAEDIQINGATEKTVVTGIDSLKVAKAKMIEGFERNYISQVLAACGGNISQAARKARKDRRAFYALMKKYKLTGGQALEPHGAQL
jgi:two-component system, NtrC family, response regulator GlrR